MKKSKEQLKFQPETITPEYETLLVNSASANDCTGLIPALPADDAQRESYEELYPYIPKSEG